MPRVRVIIEAAVLALIVAGTVVALAPASTSPSKLAPVHGPYHPDIHAANFVHGIDNRYLPFAPGARWVYKGGESAAAQTDAVVVLRHTKTILGIRCTVVRDTVSEHGRAIERTFDYYAQDREGNVWYMGELSRELQHGRLVKAGDSWQSGVKGGKPGIIMPASPRVGDEYRQEYYPPGKALDEAQVLGIRGPLKVPYGTFKHVLVTLEHSPVESQTEKKLYVAGIGEVKERLVTGGHEEFTLVSFKK